MQDRSQEGIFFSSPNKNSQKSVRFQWSGNLYKFLSLCFELGPTPRIFTKLLKVPMALLIRVNIRIIIYLDDIMGRKNLGFVINLKKSVLHPVKQIELLGLVIDTEKMTLTLSEKKLKYVSQRCQEIFAQPKTSVLNLAKFIGLLPSTVKATLPARIQFRYLQQEQILALQKKGHWHVTLENLAREELLWWMKNLKLCNGRINSAKRTPYDHSDKWLNKKLGACCKGVLTRGNGQRGRSIFT